MSKAKVAVITGGVRGIGRAIAIDLARAGWRVAMCYRTSEDDARTASSAVVDAGGEAAVTCCDVSDPVAVDQWISGIYARWGRIDALINCAGPYHHGTLLEQTPAQWRSMFENNLDPVFFTARSAAPHMVAAGRGRIITFSMANADRVAANTGVTAYFIAKTGVQQLTRALAKELAGHGITVNSISPGFIDTKSVPAEELESMTESIPAGHVGTVADTVAAARFLLSDEAAYVNGSNLIVSGGWGV